MAKAFAASISIVESKAALNPANRQVIDVPSSFRILEQECSSSSSSLASADDEVRVVSLAEYKEAALSLAEAFAEDDVARYFIDVPDREHWTEAEKWKLHVDILEYVTYAHCLKGLVTTVGANYGAVALWMPPGQNMDDFLTILRSGMWRLNYKLSAEGKRRFFNEFLPLLHDAKQAVLGERDDDAWYLVYIGTRPNSRGKGYARKLIEHVTKRADREGRPCYLESSNDVNPKIYRKMGFEEVRRIHLQRGPKNVDLDIMVREPAGYEKNRIEEVKLAHL
ncbi:hypothetical protein GQ43DRAFT_135990 [Delitschia confertaspora ATCC 74209]|uniref:N-acetyltransferase domain-containing protein n=1 Tax=Delitschia confertaspora ATCC 74209 TaxID=1513339 RepID=A0A9P4JWE2_9PLEO|nr:hypothetical protein GQ43DRAFT_135990 [Delitschia confertaspora ATCC 74209]